MAHTGRALLGLGLVALVAGAFLDGTALAHGRDAGHAVAQDERAEPSRPAHDAHGAAPSPDGTGPRHADAVSSVESIPVDSAPVSEASVSEASVPGRAPQAQMPAIAASAAVAPASLSAVVAPAPASVASVPAPVAGALATAGEPAGSAPAVAASPVEVTPTLPAAVAPAVSSGVLRVPGGAPGMATVAILLALGGVFLAVQRRWDRADARLATIAHARDVSRFR